MHSADLLLLNSDTWSTTAVATEDSRVKNNLTTTRTNDQNPSAEEEDIDGLTYVV